MAFIRYELSWDRHHQSADRIFHVLWAKPSEGVVVQRATGALGPALKETFPEVVDFVRVDPRWVWFKVGGAMVRYNLDVVDPSVFDVFTIPFLAGDRRTAFATPDALVISESAAKSWFPDEDPIGKTVTLESNLSAGDYRITGVVEDKPRNSSLRFELFTNATVGSESAKVPGRSKQATFRWQEWSGSKSVVLFLLLRTPEDAARLTAALPEFLAQHLGEEWASQHEYRLQPLDDMHLNNKRYGLRPGELGPLGSDMETLCLIGGTALLILLVACVNFINLSLAQAGTRHREIGVRKATGARRVDLIRQFILESTLTTSAAIVIGFAIAVVCLPVFSDHSGHRMPDTLTVVHDVLPYVPVLWIGVVLLSGLYPAAVLSVFDPVHVLKSAYRGTTKGRAIRKALILGQFAICILALAGTMVTHGRPTSCEKRTWASIETWSSVWRCSIPITSLNRTSPNACTAATGRSKAPCLRIRASSGFPRITGPRGCTEGICMTFRQTERESACA